MNRTLLILLVLCLQVACVPQQRPQIYFTGKDVSDTSSGLIVIGDPSRDRIIAANYFGEFRVDLPYATDWVFRPGQSREQLLHANSPSLDLIVTVQSYQPGLRVDPERYLRDEILANTAAGFQRRFGAEPRNVRVSSQGGRPVLEYDIVANGSMFGAAPMEISQHNLWAMLQRDSDDVVLDLHVSTTVPISDAGDVGLARLHTDLAEMMATGFVEQPH